MYSSYASSAQTVFYNIFYAMRASLDKLLSQLGINCCSVRV